MEEIILIGAGGHCRSIIEAIESKPGLYKINGILDSVETGDVFGYKILGTDGLIPSLAKTNSFVISIGNIQTTAIREKVAMIVDRSNGKFATIISDKAYVSKRAKLGRGNVVLNFSNINANCSIGNNCIFNTASNIEHDCKIGDFVHISTGAMVNGNCIIGDRCFLGSNSVIANGITVTHDVIIGAGAVVINDIMEPGTYVGNPIKRIK